MAIGELSEVKLNYQNPLVKISLVTIKFVFIYKNELKFLIASFINTLSQSNLFIYILI